MDTKEHSVYLRHLEYFALKSYADNNGVSDIDALTEIVRFFFENKKEINIKKKEKSVKKNKTKKEVDLFEN